MKKTFEVGPGLHCDVDRLVASRLLVQANSGGGKTRTLRRLLEQTHGKLQHLIIDPEGEYHTLRERYDYILAAPAGGDVVAHPRTAKLLAERLLQLGVSAILDIFELNPDDRVLFVQRFLDALVNAPRDLWHPALIVLDEAHVYCPEGKENASTTAVKAMASRGRKRGFCLVPATQRLAKLSKDVAAECNNKLIGRCTLDVDIKRASEELGFTSKAEQQGLRQLEPGQFYAYGPAFDVKAPVLVLVGEVRTSHPEAGQKAAPPPPPTDKVKALLPKLSDLPAEAADRERTVSEMKKAIFDKDKRIKELERDVKLSTTGLHAASIDGKKPEVKSVPALTDADRALIEKLATEVRDQTVALHSEVRQTEARIGNLVRAAVTDCELDLAKAVDASATRLEKTFEKASVKKLIEKLNGLAVPPAHPVPGSRFPAKAGASALRTPSASPSRAPSAHRSLPVGDGTLSGPEQKILGSLAELEALGLHPADKQQLGLMAGYTNVRSGGFSEPLGRLIAGGYATSPQAGKVAITDAGRAAAGDVQPPADPEEMQARIMAKLSGPETKLLKVIIARYPNAISKEDLGTECGYTNIRSGGFSEPLGRLNTLGIIRTPARGEVVASPALFLEGK